MVAEATALANYTKYVSNKIQQYNLLLKKRNKWLLSHDEVDE